MDMTSIRNFSKEFHSQKDSSHDFTHIKRIVELCKRIAPPEADIDLIVKAAHLHGLESKELNIRDFLRSLGLESSHIERIIGTIRNARSVAKPQTVEEKVLHDANILDGLGAVGIARAFTKGGYEHQTLKETVGIMKKNMERALYTPKAKEIAEERKDFMRKFLKYLEEELYVP